ncbi:MAG: AAA family ATPase, partial [Nitrospinaceae bacterium]|nr:AAA family ATPase [Nitrospinaceae bacterium]NIR54962.1 AAA family ATPase [Nitrospinaceae bacterium]NIS85375.1 AAA family ATPase [Nitrospinaceae bacterium]NIT82202.1 AAA family ATPase [Nitrospinaceae bacterium]NIU44446.1 AAA family ATPase [Nitrospinaceae bacterium]
MYIEYYQFKEKPFNLTPDPKFLYYSKHHQGALDHLLYGIKEREGFMALMGGVGTGKTTLCRALLDSLDDKVNVALVLNPMISTMDLFRTLIQELNISPARPVQRSRLFQDFDIPLEEMDPDKEEEDKVEWIQTASKKQMFDALNDYLLAQHSQGRSTVLIIDEAQTLSFEVLEQVRLLSNLETEKEKLLQIIFVGQKELNDRLLEPELKQLNQRISIRYEIFPLSLEECRNYINHRLTLASQFPRVVFTPKAIQRIHEYSQGYPRLINLACDRALLAAYNDQVDVIDRKQVKQAIRSLSGETTQLVAEEESSGWAWATAAGVVLALFAG